MSIQGKVWLDEPQGKNSEANGEYDSGDKLLEGITVKLYESDGVSHSLSSESFIENVFVLFSSLSYPSGENISSTVISNRSRRRWRNRTTIRINKQI